MVLPIGRLDSLHSTWLEISGVESIGFSPFYDAKSMLKEELRNRQRRDEGYRNFPS